MILVHLPELARVKGGLIVSVHCHTTTGYQPKFNNHLGNLTVVGRGVKHYLTKISANNVEHRYVERVAQPA